MAQGMILEYLETRGVNYCFCMLLPTGSGRLVEHEAAATCTTLHTHMQIMFIVTTNLIKIHADVI